jgi:signal transduction histidine kinase/ActR/RegA family two-component response regulator
VFGPTEWVILRPDGRRVPVLLCAAMVPGGDVSVSILLDLSERKHLEDQLRQSNKLEAIGLLAGGVAHDMNNILSVVISYAALVADELAPGDPRADDIREILRAGDRGRVLTRQLLAFSRQQVLEPVILDLGEVAGGVEKMLRRLIGEDVELVLELAPDLPKVKADPGQIEQVIMNLAINARDAMPRGGRLTLRTRDAWLDGGLRTPVGLAAGRYVELTVADTGKGMDAATRLRIFEPFFTTKERGRGTGLGLSTALGIVQQSGGAMEVESELGAGTSFRIYLPADVDPEASPRTRRAPLSAEQRLDGSETVLVAEDDPQVRRAVRSMLERHGYRVIEAENGRAALDLFRGGARPDLLLTDVVMPLLSGRELVEEVWRLDPEMKVIFMSGYTDDAILRHGVAELGLTLVQKPFSTGELLGRLRAVLDAAQPAAAPARY